MQTQCSCLSRRRILGNIIAKYAQKANIQQTMHQNIVSLVNQEHILIFQEHTLARNVTLENTLPMNRELPMLMHVSIVLLEHIQIIREAFHVLSA
jgi:hypothetical protein